MIDRMKFFADAKASLGSLKQTQVDGFNAILDAWDNSGLSDTRWLAYMLATAWHETAKTMQPIAEYGHGKGRSYGHPDPATGKVYYGRGYVQLTWLSNYEAFSKVCGVDMVHDPELALRPDIASKVMFYGMQNGTFTGKRLSSYFNKITDDPVGARRIINGTDQASTIAGYHRDFLKALIEVPGEAPRKAADTPTPTPLPPIPKKTDEAPAPLQASPVAHSAPAPPKLGFWARLLAALKANQERVA